MHTFYLYILLWMVLLAPVTFKVYPKWLASLRTNVMTPEATIQSNICLQVWSLSLCDLLSVFSASSGPLSSSLHVFIKYYVPLHFCFFLRELFTIYFISCSLYQFCCCRCQPDLTTLWSHQSAQVKKHWARSFPKKRRPGLLTTQSGGGEL